jgi:hypothetical protein
MGEAGRWYCRRTAEGGGWVGGWLGARGGGGGRGLPRGGSGRGGGAGAEVRFEGRMRNEGKTLGKAASGTRTMREKREKESVGLLSFLNLNTRP